MSFLSLTKPVWILVNAISYTYAALAVNIPVSSHTNSRSLSQPTSSLFIMFNASIIIYYCTVLGLFRVSGDHNLLSLVKTRLEPSWTGDKKQYLDCVIIGTYYTVPSYTIFYSLFFQQTFPLYYLIPSHLIFVTSIVVLFLSHTHQSLSSCLFCVLISFV